MSMLGTLARIVRHEVKTLRGVLYRRIAVNKADERTAIDEFHKLYFEARAFNQTWRNTYWMGHPILKCPLDLWLYQELFFRLRPAVIVETGTAFGASAHFMATMMDLIGHGQVVTIDVEERPGRPSHARVTYLTGSSIAPDMVARVRERVGNAGPIMVVLDSDHRREHVLAELNAYAPLVTPGSYLIVEDTNLNGHPVDPEHGPGPMEALEAFLQGGAPFEHDAEMDKFLLTFNPRGFLKRR